MTTIAHLELLDHGLNALQAKVDDLNKRAAKHGLEPITLKTKTLQFVRVTKANFHPAEDLHFVEIQGVEPRIDGWRMIAKIEFDPDLGNVVKQVPHADQVELDPKYRTVSAICQHCGVNRKRNEVFVLRHNDEEKIVGRNCLADFIRSGDAEQLAEWARMAEVIASWSEDDDESSNGGYGGYYEGPSGISLLRYLTMTSCVIRKWGWVSRTVSRDTDQAATSDWVSRCFGRGCHKFIATNDLYPTDYDYELAEKAIEWAKSKAGDRSEYLNTLSQLASHEDLVWKYDGYTASILSAYLKEQDLLEAAKRKPPRVFLGEPKQRLRGVVAKVLRMRFTEGQYGTKTIITFEAPQGDSRAILTWFASGDRSNEFSEGEDVSIDATVKKHESDERFGDSTIIQRVTRVDNLVV